MKGLGAVLLGLGTGLLVAALLPRRVRRVDREWLVTAAAACLVLGAVALEASR